MEAARLFGIDHRRIWLWAGMGQIRHVEIESADGGRKTYYVLADIERVLQLETDTREQVSRYAERLGFGFTRELVGATSATG